MNSKKISSSVPNYSEIASIIERHGYPDPVRITNEIIQFTKESGRSINDILRRISTGEPWDYIKGASTFRNRRFQVDQNVLIPRVETEILVEITLKAVRKYLKSAEKINLIDVGTGSGCILISILKELEESGEISHVTRKTGIDISEKALEIAKGNCRGIEIDWLASDLLSNYETRNNDAINIITANLPYIRSDEENELDRSVTEWEPSLALFDKDNDGLGLTRKLLSQVLQKFPRFYLIYEIDPKQTEIMKRYLDSTELNQNKLKFQFHKDQFGKSRFLEIIREESPPCIN